MKNIMKLLMTCGLIFLYFSQCVGQSAIGQLETISGQKIGSTKVSSPSTQTVITGMVMQSVLNSIFSTPSGPSEADLKAQRDAEIAAIRAAEEKRIADSLFQIKHNKLIQETKTLNNGTVMNLKTLDDKKLTSSYVPPVAPSQPASNVPDHYILDFERSLVNTVIGKIAPNNILKYGGIATNDLIFEDIKAGIDCFSTTSTYCPSSSTILKNAFVNASKDATTQFVGDKVGDIVEAGNGKFYSAIASKKMIKNDLLVRYVDGVVKEGKIAEIGSAYSKIASTGEEAFDFGNDLQQAWGKYRAGK
jgi:hypothetical protein